MAGKGDITPLLPYVGKPYRVAEVIEVAKKLQAPFLLREVAREANLPKHICQRVLERLVKQERATRIKVRVAYPQCTGGQGGDASKIRWRPGGAIRDVWAYTLAAGE